VDPRQTTVRPHTRSPRPPCPTHYSGRGLLLRRSLARHGLLQLAVALHRVALVLRDLHVLPRQLRELLARRTRGLGGGLLRLARGCGPLVQRRVGGPPRSVRLRGGPQALAQLAVPPRRLLLPRLRVPQRALRDQPLLPADLALLACTGGGAGREGVGG